jgi:hypothetical protein
VGIAGDGVGVHELEKTAELVRQDFSQEVDG